MEREREESIDRERTKRHAKKLNPLSSFSPLTEMKNSTRPPPRSPALPAAFRNQILTGGRGGGAFSSRFGGGGRGGGGGASSSMSSGGSGTPAPVRLLGGASFLHLRAGDVHVLAVTRDNVNAMLAFSFMVKVSEEKRGRERGFIRRRRKTKRYIKKNEKENKPDLNVEI